MSVLIEIWITSCSIFSCGVSLRVSVLINSSKLYSKYYYVKRVFGNFIFAIIAQIFCRNHLKLVAVIHARKHEHEKEIMF